MRQLTLPLARATDPGTSHGAAAQARTRAPRHREIVLRVLREAGPGGLTDFQIGERCGLQQTSAGKRRLDLQRMGLVEATGERRPSPSGTPAMVWRYREAGQ